MTEDTLRLRASHNSNCRPGSRAVEERSLWLWIAGSPGLFSLVQRAMYADASMERALYGSVPGKDKFWVISAS